MKLKCMTFNLRVTVRADGINSFPNRKTRILECIAKEQPDIIGFQEAGNDAREFLREALGDTYVVLGCGRKADYRGESCPIAYRRDRAELVNFSTRFLSDTPQIPGSRYENSDQSPCPRLFVHAELSWEGIGETIHFINTHLDHEGAEARRLGMQQILNETASVSGAKILTGDMNAEPNEACIRLACEHGLTDTTASIVHTFHDFGRRTEPFKIDYIFSNRTALTSYAVEDVPQDGVYISDHYPVVTELEI